jgi:drug/metabolite transporter (DMT)-like permease
MWGFSFVAAEVVLSVLSPVILAAVRFAIASLFFAPVIAVEFYRGDRPDGRRLAEFAFLGFISISIYFVLQYTGVEYAGAGLSALLAVGLVPIMTGMTSALLLHESYGIRQVSGTVLGFIGVALAIAPGLFLKKIDLDFYVGVLCLMLNAACWALYSTLSRRLMKRTSKPLLTASYVTVLGTLLLIPISATSNWSAVEYLGIEQWLGILYLVLGCSCAAYFLWNFSLSTMEAVRVTVWQYLEPLVAFIGQAVIFGTIPTATTIAGGVAIIAGALLTNWPLKRPHTQLNPHRRNHERLSKVWSKLCQRNRRRTTKCSDA